MASGFVTPCIHFLNSNQVACVAPMAANKVHKEELSPFPEYKLIGSDEEGLGGECASNLTSKRHFSSSERTKHPKESAGGGDFPARKTTQLSHFSIKVCADFSLCRLRCCVTSEQALGVFPAVRAAADGPFDHKTVSVEAGGCVFFLFSYFSSLPSDPVSAHGALGSTGCAWARMLSLYTLRRNKAFEIISRGGRDSP